MRKSRMSKPSTSMVAFGPDDPAGRGMGTILDTGSKPARVTQASCVAPPIVGSNSSATMDESARRGRSISRSFSSVGERAPLGSA